MDSLLFEIKDNKDELHRVVVSDMGSILTINDDFMTKQVMARKGIEKIKYCLIKPNVENLTLVIRNYTLTDTIYIESFCDVRSDINIFQSIGTNIHMTEQKIQHMQVDCASVFAADCSVEKMEIGIFSVVNQYKNLSGAQENIAYKMDKLELRDMNVGILDLYAECKYINVQRSRINEFNNNGNMLKNVTSTVGWINIWQNTHIGKLSIGNKIEKMTVDDTSIDKVVARAKLYIDTLKIKDSNIENAYGFEKKQFNDLTYDIWEWIGKSADNSRNVRGRAEANYQMAKLLYKTEKGTDKFMSSLFDFCAGYGYKPFRIIRTSGIMVLVNTFMFSFIKFVEILSKMWAIPLNGESFCKGATIVWNYFLISIAALAGQNSFELREGLPYWLSVIEYLLGVVLFAMFVNALYARYKE
ncbi:MAG: hypothetical protein ACLRQC_04725 [Dorea formicigenerans]